jgi:hypothetical protein
MGDDRRLEPRYALSVPIRIGDIQATTVDMSLGGVAFMSPVAFGAHSNIAFSVVLRATGIPVQMDCRGTVTRSESAGAAFLVAATIDHFRIASENTMPAPPARVTTL